MSSRGPQNLARRSRSPQNHRLYERSRSPKSHRHHQVSQKHKRSKPSAPAPLPLQASKLHKKDFETFKPMFELYLDIQKQKVLDELPDYEVKGRWKSFVGKWYISTFYSCFPFPEGLRYKGLTLVRNRGELAEGWYDPITLQKAQASALSNAVNAESQSRPRDLPSYDSPERAEDVSDEDVVGPRMPGVGTNIYKSDKKAGPAIPNLQDLELQRGTTSRDNVLV